MIGEISRIDSKFVSFPAIEDPIEASEKEGAILESPKEKIPVVLPLGEYEEGVPAFDYCVKCLAEKSLRTIDIIRLSKASNYVKNHFQDYLSEAEDIHAYLEEVIPPQNPLRPVSNFALSKVRACLYKKMGGLLRYLNASGKFKELNALVQTGLFGKVSGDFEIRVASLHPDKKIQQLKFSVMSQLHIPFCGLKLERQKERLDYYDLFYSLLNQKETKLQEIREVYLDLVKSEPEIDFENREIKVSTGLFQAIVYITHAYFKDLIDFAIDQEMEVRVIYLILQVVLGDLAHFFHVPNHPSVFILKDAMQDVNEKIINQNDSCANFFLNDIPIKSYLSRFVDHVLLKPNAIKLILAREEHMIGGRENEFPIDEIKSFFLKQFKKMNSQDLIKKIKECPALAKVLSKKGKLDKTDYSIFLKEAYERYNSAKTFWDGNFIIHRLNQICDGVPFSECELSDLSKESIEAVEFMFPLFLLQCLILTNDNFFEEFHRLYRTKKCVDGHCFSVSHAIDSLDEHRFTYLTDFLESSVTGYTVTGTLYLNSFWGESQTRMVPFKKIAFSPFISFDTFFKLGENIFLEMDFNAFKANVLKQFISASRSVNKEVLINIDRLKARLREIILLKHVLDDLKVSSEYFKDALENLKSLEKIIREKMWSSKDSELSQYYHGMYSENGFLR